MKMSEVNKMKLYNAIYDPIMDLRIAKLRNRDSLSADTSLFNLSENIWQRVQEVLNIQDVINVEVSKD